MKNLIMCLFITCTLHPAEIPPFQQPKKNPDMAEHWAQYTSKKTKNPEKIKRTRNRLNNDPEQQEEHAQGCYADIIKQLHRIEEAVENIKTDENEDREKKLENYELACSVIAQALLHLHDKGNKKALEQADARVLILAGQIKLMQDSFWSTVVQDITKKKKTALPPIYSIDELEQDLYIPESKKDRLIKLLLNQLENKEQSAGSYSIEAIDELSEALASHRKKPEDIIVLFSKITSVCEATRIKDKKRASDLYNGAVISEIQADIQFLQLKDKHQYPLLEHAYGTVALLYLKAYDHGHEKGLEEAEKIMRSKVIDTIISWKERHGIKEPYGYNANIWEEINKRKYAHPHQSASLPSSSTPIASSSQPSV